MQHSIDNIKKITSLEYLIMFFVICISGNPLFIYANTKYLYIFTVCLMYLICFLKNKSLINGKFIFWFSCSCLLFLFQYASLELTSISADINFIARLYIAFLTAMFFDYRFREVYFRVMSFICAVSLIFFTIGVVTKSGFGIIYNRYNTVLLYNSIEGIFDRNCGMFWEPGAFQGFIILVPLLYLDKLKELWKKHKIGCIILFLTLLTTKSTTGYLAFITFILLIILFNTKIKFIYKIPLIVLSIVGFSIIWKQYFMMEKVVEQFEEAINIRKGDVSWNRMGAMVIDYENIKRHPIIGNGFMDESRYGILGKYMRGAGNGFSGAINMFGIPFMLLYFIGLFRNFNSISKLDRFIIIIIIILILNGEYMLNYPFFWSLLFISIPRYEKSISAFNSAQSQRKNYTMS